MARFTLTREVVETFEEGWGVYVEPIWEDQGFDSISEVLGSVVRIDERRAVLIGGQWCVLLPDWGTEAHPMYCPISNFQRVEDLTEDDTHDLRCRWFATRKEAREHLDYTIRRFHNPSPWESFVKVS